MTENIIAIVLPFGKLLRVDCNWSGGLLEPTTVAFLTADIFASFGVLPLSCLRG